MINQGAYIIKSPAVCRLKERALNLMKVILHSSHQNNQRDLLWMREGGFSLTEMIVVVFIFTFLFLAVFTILHTSDRSWRIGQNKLIEQQEARKAMGEIVRLLRQTSPRWTGEDDSSYPVSITSGNRIDFYLPSFNQYGEISAFRKITFKLNPDNPHQLLKKEGIADSVVVANDIESINFGGGCSGCSAFNCSTVADDCPQVKIDIRTHRETDYDLDSRVTLRNASVIIPSDISVEQPEEGEF